MNNGFKVACVNCNKYMSNRKVCSWCRKHPDGKALKYVVRAEGPTPYSVDAMKQEISTGYYRWE